jgi:drug/metabolite transporter (DMT)-like permease
MLPRIVAAPPFPHAAEAAALASSLLWAVGGILFRRLRGRLSPAALNFGKNTTGAVCLGLLGCVVWGRPWPTHVPLAAQGWLVASGIVGLSICDTFLLRAFMEIGPRRATLLMLLAPVLIFLGALLPPFAQTSVLSAPGKLAGAALALVGIGATAFEAPDVHADRARARRGTIDALIASVLQAIGVLLTAKAIQEGAGPLEGSTIRLATASAALALAALFLGLWPAWRRAFASPGTTPALARAAFLGTFLGIGLNTCALAWTTSTGVASTLNSLAPVWLIPLSRFFLGERHSRLAWISTLVALVGVALLSG